MEDLKECQKILDAYRNALQISFPIKFRVAEKLHVQLFGIQSSILSEPGNGKQVTAACSVIYPFNPFYRCILWNPWYFALQTRQAFIRTMIHELLHFKYSIWNVQGSYHGRDWAFWSRQFSETKIRWAEYE